MEGNTYLASMLACLRFSLNWRDQSGETALHYVVRHGHVETLHLLSLLGGSGKAKSVVKRTNADCTHLRRRCVQSALV